ncbi:MAG: type IV secretory system conjugative DNA transfer family protein [Acidimicrobiales bacterium]
MGSDRPILGRRTWHGVAYGPVMRLAERSSLLIVGPTQAGKTSALVVPALLSWSGPAVVTSVKRDVVDATLAWRSTLGSVHVLEPGLDDGLTWNPLEGVTSLRHALRVARDLTSGSSAKGDIEFWNTLSTKLVASLMMRAYSTGRDIFDVSAAVEHRQLDEWLAGGVRDDACDVLNSFLNHDTKTLDGVLTTAETMLLPWRFRQRMVSVREIVGRADTLYLCSPRGEQVHYEPLFRGALRMILEEQQRRCDQGRQRPLLMVLDEAATVASLDELDQLAATVSGLDVTLVTVVQDFAQLAARWGPRAATIVNNHTTRMVLGGIADPTVATYLPELEEQTAKARPVPLRQRSRGTAFVVAGRRPVIVVRLRPWWKIRRLQHRGTTNALLPSSHGD